MDIPSVSFVQSNKTNHFIILQHKNDIILCKDKKSMDLY